MDKFALMDYFNIRLVYHGARPAYLAHLIDSEVKKIRKEFADIKITPTNFIYCKYKIKNRDSDSDSDSDSDKKRIEEKSYFIHMKPLAKGRPVLRGKVTFEKLEKITDEESTWIGKVLGYQFPGTQLSDKNTLRIDYSIDNRPIYGETVPTTEKFITRVEEFQRVANLLGLDVPSVTKYPRKKIAKITAVLEIIPPSGKFVGQKFAII